jgi:predicted nucleic acid-binding protein
LTFGDAADGAVLDASVALAWVLPGETSDEALRLRNLAVEEPITLFCPPTFWYEVANALWVAIRRERMSNEAAQQALGALRDFLVESHEVDAAACLSLSTEYGLAVYDAAYIVLALDRKAPLWSLDREMASVARNMGIWVRPDQQG